MNCVGLLELLGATGVGETIKHTYVFCVLEALRRGRLYPRVEAKREILSPGEGKGMG